MQALWEQSRGLKNCGSFFPPVCSRVNVNNRRCSSRVVRFPCSSFTVIMDRLCYRLRCLISLARRRWSEENPSQKKEVRLKVHAAVISRWRSAVNPEKGSASEGVCSRDFIMRGEDICLRVEGKSSSWWFFLYDRHGLILCCDYYLPLVRKKYSVLHFVQNDFLHTVECQWSSEKEIPDPFSAGFS
jgi:hypothetical protein